MDNFKEFEKFEKYTLIKKIAVGGMAEIFLVKTEKTAGISQFVVLKRISPQFSSNNKFRVMFKNEGKVSSHLKHSNLVHHYEFGVHKGTYFIVMEYISGVSLKDFMRRVSKTGKKISIPVAITLIRSMSAALHHINNSIDPETGEPLNLIHRDVTPHNIMIGFNGDIKLIDFGIAKVEGLDLTSAGIVKGKFSYMSPEQISGSKVSHRSDIFSLGVVFWELLTGKKLFEGANIQAIFQKIKTGNIPSVTKYRPDIHPELSDILSQMLRKNPITRFSEAESVERKLSLFLNKQHTNFSHLDFNGFVKKLYSQDIEKERKFIVKVNKRLVEFQNNQHNGTSQIDQNTIVSAETVSPHDSISDVKIKTDVPEKEIIQFEKGTKKTKLNPFRAEPTRISPQAPLSYSRTQIFNKNLNDKDIEIQQTDDELESESKTGSSTYFNDLVRVYSKRKENKIKEKKYKFLGMLLVIGGLVGLITQYSTKNLKNIKQVYRSVEADFNDDLDSEALLPEAPLHSLDESKSPTQKINPDSSRNIASSSLEHFRVYIETNPSGAFVKLNGQKIDKTTPLFINVPNQIGNVLEVERVGYEPYKISELDSKSEIQITLKRIKKRRR